MKCLDCKKIEKSINDDYNEDEILCNGGNHNEDEILCNSRKSLVENSWMF